MDNFVVIRHREPVNLEARRIEHEAAPADQVALAFFVADRLVARGAVPESAVEPLSELLSEPVTLALAVTADDSGNIDGRVCVVLPVPTDAEQEGEGPDEPWKASLPPLPSGIESGPEGDDSVPRLLLLPLGHVVRAAANRKHPELADDARDMLQNLLSGGGQDAVSRAIDDLLRNL